MSGQMKISFDPDMPPAAVEVVAPDCSTVGRLMLDAGREATVEVPSEGSFLRVHLPSGKVVTLTEERGQLTRKVSRASLEAAQGITRTTERRSLATQGKNLRQIRQYHLARSIFREAAPPEDMAAGVSVPLGFDKTAQVFGPNGARLPGKSNPTQDEATWELGNGSDVDPPSRLEVLHPGGVFYVLLPGNTQSIYARTDEIEEGRTVVFGVRLATRQPMGDAVLGYLESGDLHAAGTMVTWVEEARAMLEGKLEDPYAAAIGGYLLLKLRRFDLMHDWVRNLANWFPFLPDGCVLWAWQQIHQNPSNVGAIRRYLVEATKRGRQGLQGLPVYSHGLRLLLDGLSMLEDDEARAAAEKLREAAGAVLWDSPITAGVKLDRATVQTAIPVTYDVSFMPQA
jgi:hypothetical protein